MGKSVLEYGEAWTDTSRGTPDFESGQLFKMPLNDHICLKFEIIRYRESSERAQGVHALGVICRYREPRRWAVDWNQDKRISILPYWIKFC